MANEATILRIRAQVENLEGLNRARSAVRNFATESKAASNDLDKLRSMFKELGSESIRSVNNLKNYRTGLDALRQSAEIGSKTFNELTSEIKQLDIELGSLQGKQAQVASGFNKIASSANAAAAATRRQFDLSGAGATFGRTIVAGQARTIRDTTQYAQPIGPRAVDYAAVNTGLTQAVQAEQQLTDLSRRARQERLLIAEKYNNLEIAAADKKAREELRIQQQGSDRALADFDRRLAARGKKRANLQRFGQTAGAVAAAGVFGGPEGLIGAGIGAIGGPGGALAGGAIGATVGGIRQAIGETAKYTAELQLLRIALGGVSTSSKDFDNNLQAVDRLSKRFLIPLKDTTEQYTKLQASVQGAGMTSKQTEVAFKGIAAAIIATGGSTQDLNSALLATSQVFSKGKVSAEELRGQIGERLPGAFAIFAASYNKTPQELDKALKDGEVTLADFLKFTEELFKRYGKTADIIAEAPQNAGKRLTLALDNITLQIGRFAGPIGAAFQSIATNIVNGLAPAFEAFANLLDLPKIAAKERLPQIKRQIKAAQKQINTYKLGEALPGGRLAFAIPRRLQQTQLKALQGERKLIEVTLASIGSGVKRNTARVGDTVGGDGNAAGKAKGETAAANALAASKERTTVLKKEADTLFDMALMQDKIYDLGQKGGKQAIVDLTFERDRLKILGEYDVKSTKVDNTANKNAELQALRKMRNVELVALQLKFEEQTREVIREQNQLRTTAKQQIENVLIASGAISAEEAAKIQLERTVADFREQFKTLVDVDALSEQLRKALEQASIDAKDFGKQFGKSFQDGIKSMGDLGANLGSSFASAFERMSDQLTEFVTTGKANFADFAASVLKDISSMIIRYAIFNAVQGIMNIFNPAASLGSSASNMAKYAPLNAKGNVFAQNGIQAFARGGIVSGPTLFPFAKGIGLMGEAGPEAIMPLRRGRDGNLGVMSSGGGTTNVVVNVDASGSSVEGNQSQAKALGNAISAAVQSELVKQKRPGGLLA